MVHIDDPGTAKRSQQEALMPPLPGVNSAGLSYLSGLVGRGGGKRRGSGHGCAQDAF